MRNKTPLKLNAFSSLNRRCEQSKYKQHKISQIITFIAIYERFTGVAPENSSPLTSSISSLRDASNFLFSIFCIYWSEQQTQSGPCSTPSCCVSLLFGPFNAITTIAAITYPFARGTCVSECALCATFATNYTATRRFRFQFDKMSYFSLLTKMNLLTVVWLHSRSSVSLDGTLHIVAILWDQTWTQIKSNSIDISMKTNYLPEWCKNEKVHSIEVVDGKMASEAQVITAEQFSIH